MKLFSESDIRPTGTCHEQAKSPPIDDFILSKYKAYPYERIASMLKLSVANVKVQVHRSISQLRKLYFALDKCG
jgi:DNA-directed RNA polymerase specialized sigma24 family protein